MIPIFEFISAIIIIFKPNNVTINEPPCVGYVEKTVKNHHFEVFSPLIFHLFVVNIAKDYVKNVISRFNSDP